MSPEDVEDLDCTLHSADSDTLCIVCHGYGGDKDHDAVIGICQGLVDRGIDALRFTFTRQDKLRLDAMLDDIDRIINAYGHDYDRIVLVGGSIGAIPTTLASIRNPAVSALVSVNGFLRPWRHPRYWLLRVQSLWDVEIRKTIRELKSFDPSAVTVPTLVIHSIDDEYVSEQHSLIFYDRLQCEKRYAAIDGSHHMTPRSGLLAVRRIADWLNAIQ